MTIDRPAQAATIKPNPLDNSAGDIRDISKTNNMKNKITQEERLVYMLIGKRGGEATAKRYGKKYMSNLGKKGARKRWGRAGSKKKKLL